MHRKSWKMLQCVNYRMLLYCTWVSQDNKWSEHLNLVMSTLNLLKVQWINLKVMLNMLVRYCISLTEYICWFCCLYWYCLWLFFSIRAEIVVPCLCMCVYMPMTEYTCIYATLYIWINVNTCIYVYVEAHMRKSVYTCIHEEIVKVGTNLYV